MPSAAAEITKFNLSHWLNGRRFNLRDWLTGGDGKTPESATQERDRRALAVPDDGSVKFAGDALPGHTMARKIHG